MSSRDRRRSPRRDDRSRDRDRRRRSVSPPRGRSRRSPRRDRDDDHHRRDRGYDGRDEGRGGQRGRSPDRGRPRGPMKYKDFMRKLDDNILPADAEQAYQDYLADFWRTEQKRDFEQNRMDDPELRAKYDPREVAKTKEQRAARLVEAAATFMTEVKEGKLDVAAEDFNQGEGPSAPQPPEPGSEEEEKAEQTVKEEEEEMKDPEEEKAGSDDVKEEEEKEEEQEKDDSKMEDKVDSKAEEAAAEMDGTSKEPSEKERTKKADADKPVKLKWAPASAWAEEQIASDLELAQELARKLDEECGITDNVLLPPKAAADEEDDEEMAEPEVSKHIPSEPVAHLDLLLTYLWRVHEIDFYAGKEHVKELSAEDSKKPAHRRLRGHAPPPGEEAPGPTAEEHRQEMDKAWKPRMEDGGPFEQLLRSKMVQEKLDEWLENQVTQMEENKWGCTLSIKLFVAKEFVLKHIHLKHSHLVDAEKQKILNDVYVKNYMDDVEQMPAPEMGGGPAGPHAAGPMHGPGGPMGRMHRHGRGPRPMVGRGGPMGPMMGRGGPMGRGPMGGYGPMMGPHMGGPMMMGPGGPMGPPFMMGGPMGFMGHPMMGGPMGPMGMGRGGREYHDLDAPKNNRAVLDYGDL